MITSVDAISNDLLVVYGDDKIDLTSNENSWATDIGVCFHVTSRKEFFTHYTPFNFGVLKMGNDG